MLLRVVGGHYNAAHGNRRVIGFTVSEWLKFLVSLAASVWLLVDRRPWGAGRAWRGPGRRGWALILLALLAALGVWLWVASNNVRRAVHIWDTYHYYMGAKYFPELGYRRLYDCTLAADMEAGQGGDLSARYLRNLNTNQMERASDALPRAAKCRELFEPARWAMFTHDVGFFRAHQPRGRWLDIQKDHGFNATPVWIMVGRLLTSTGRAGPVQVAFLASLDFMLYGLIWIMVIRSFGVRTALAAGAFWLGNFPGRFYWTGGAFLRQPWLFCSVAGVCGLRAGRHLLAGVALGAASLLRIFPATLLFGPLLNIFRSLVGGGRPRLSLPDGRFLLGLGLSILLLVPAATVSSGGVETWRALANKLVTHLDTPSTNLMGLKVVASYTPATRAAKLVRGGTTDPYRRWRESRQQVFQERRTGFLALVGLFVLLLARAVWGREPWRAAVLSIGLIPMATSPSCYYLSILLGYGLLAGRWRGVATGLNWHALAGWFVVWLFPLNDEQYTWLSVLSVLFVVAVTAWAAVKE